MFEFNITIFSSVMVHLRCIVAEEQCDMSSRNSTEAVFTNRQYYTSPVDELTIVVLMARVKFSNFLVTVCGW